MRQSLRLAILALLPLCVPAFAAEPATTLPKVRVSGIRRAFHDGEHDAFTDLCRFNDRLYLAFRSCPDGHMVHPTARIIVLASDDCSYPGLVELRDGRALVSWYSSHERDDAGRPITAIYLAELELVTP